MFYGTKVSNKKNCLRLTLSWRKICHFLSMIEIFNLHWKCIIKFLAPTDILSLFLQRGNNRHTRSQLDFSVLQVNTVCFGKNSIKYLGPLIWNSIPTALRNVESFLEFKSLIKIRNHQTALAAYAKAIFLKFVF